jgi:hypothetical protein
MKDAENRVDVCIQLRPSCFIKFISMGLTDKRKCYQ